MLDLISQNRHWQGYPIDIQSKRRNIASSIFADLDTDLIALITGPRRVGKSVLLMQVLDDLLKVKKISPKQILTYTFLPSNTSDLLKNPFQN